MMILEADRLCITFGGVRAVDGVSIAVESGQVFSIIGPNGAGKTTMMDCITGRTRPDSGTVFFGSTIDLTRMTESAIANIGIGRKFQRPTVFETLSVFENVTLPFRLRGERVDRDRIEAALTSVGLGGRGTGQMQTLLDMPDVRVAAVCDVYADRVERARQVAKEKQGFLPDGTLDYREVNRRDDLEAVVQEVEGIGAVAHVGQGTFTVSIEGADPVDASVLGTDDPDLGRPTELSAGRFAETGGEGEVKAA